MQTCKLRKLLSYVIENMQNIFTESLIFAQLNIQELKYYAKSYLMSYALCHLSCDKCISQVVQVNVSHSFGSPWGSGVKGKRSNPC